jgi:hypothetical protein
MEEIMTDVQQQSIDLVKSFYAAKERRDLEATVGLFADDVVYTLPLSASGTPDPWFVYTGKITHVYEYANPVTYAKLAGLPIG